MWTTQQHVGKLLATKRTCLYSRQQFANLLLCRSHTPIWVCQHELANISLTCEGHFKATYTKASIPRQVFILQVIFPQLHNNLSSVSLTRFLVQKLVCQFLSKESFRGKTYQRQLWRETCSFAKGCVVVTKETLAKELGDRLFEQLLLVNIVLNPLKLVKKAACQGKLQPV